MKKILLVIAFLGFFYAGFVSAEEPAPILTTVQQVTTSSQASLDTDGDGFFDITEDTLGTSSTDPKIFPGMPLEQELNPIVKEDNPWPWYIVRVSGLVAFALLYLSIFLGLTIRIPILHKMFAPLYAMQGHCWIAFQAILFAFIHGIMLMFDTYTKFRLVDVFIMYASPIEPGLVALGIAAFYLMIIVTASSYARKHISQKMWRTLHFANIFLYVFVLIHAYKLGTDMENEVVKIIFMSANGFLILFMFFNMFVKIVQGIRRKKAISASR